MTKELILLLSYFQVFATVVMVFSCASHLVKTMVNPTLSPKGRDLIESLTSIALIFTALFLDISNLHYFYETIGPQYPELITIREFALTFATTAALVRFVLFISLTEVHRKLSQTYALVSLASIAGFGFTFLIKPATFILLL